MYKYRSIKYNRLILKRYQSITDGNIQWKYLKNAVKTASIAQSPDDQSPSIKQEKKSAFPKRLALESAQFT